MCRQQRLHIRDGRIVNPARAPKSYVHVDVDLRNATGLAGVQSRVQEQCV